MTNYWLDEHATLDEARDAFKQMYEDYVGCHEDDMHMGEIRNNFFAKNTQYGKFKNKLIVYSHVEWYSKIIRSINVIADKTNTAPWKIHPWEVNFTLYECSKVIKPKKKIRGKFQPPESSSYAPYPKNLMDDLGNFYMD